MNDRLVELYIQRGRLRERIGAQRRLVARELAPLASALSLANQGLRWFDRAKTYALAHPGAVAALLVTVLVWRPRWLLRAVRWGFVGWRGWRVWRSKAQQATDLFRAFTRAGDTPTQARPGPPA